MACAPSRPVLATFLAGAVMLLLFPAVPPAGAQSQQCPEAPFADRHEIPEAHRDNVDCVYDHAITRGYPDGTYRPREVVRRDQMAAFIVRTAQASATERQLPQPADQGFGDIDGNVHADDINILAEMGVVHGTGPDTYSPERNVTRAQIASFVLRSLAWAQSVPLEDLQSDEPRFDDVDPDNVHAANINGAAERGLIHGRTETTFAPSARARRDQMASFLIRLLHAVGAEDPAEEPQEPEAPTDLAVGDTLAMDTRDTRIEITVTELVESATPASEFDEPDAGHRLVAVRLAVANIGEDVYDTRPDLRGALIDTHDAHRDPELDNVVECDPFRSVFVSPADVRTGCLVFEVPNDRDPRAFQYKGSQGVGEWDLTRQSADPDEPRQSTAQYPGGVGDTLAMDTGDTRIEVTVTELIDPATPASEFDQPDAGHRLLAVGLTIRNIGEAVYDTRPDFRGTVVDTIHVMNEPTLDDVTDCDPFRSITISPGDQRSGCLVFEVPDDRQGRLFQYLERQGFSEWDLR